MDLERVERIQHALGDNGTDAIIAALPANVLLLTGYWPVIGASLAVVTREGRTVAIVPEDEKEMAEDGWANEIRTFSAASPQRVEKTTEAVRPVLQSVASDLGLKRARIGYEANGFFEPSTYAGSYRYGAALTELLKENLGSPHLLPADQMLGKLRSVKTAHEIERIRTACRIAHAAFLDGLESLEVGAMETEVAAAFAAPLCTQDEEIEDRVGGFTFCMSGPNSAQAYKAFQISRYRRLQDGDLALVHCNSYAGGFWTDITRTFSLGMPDDRKQKIYEAVLAGRAAALNVIKPGVRASEVDAAARDALQERGFGREFRHPLGHGVGFSAIDHGALPVLAQTSSDTLQAGMVFNSEPGIYIEGFGGVRHCDMVVVTEDGAELLTPFVSSIEELIAL